MFINSTCIQKIIIAIRAVDMRIYLTIYGYSFDKIYSLPTKAAQSYTYISKKIKV